MSFEAEVSYYNDLIDARTRIEELEQELKDTESLNSRLSRLLDATANALHGGPKENGLWSFHDLPELSTKANKRIADLENCIRELLKGGGDFDTIRKKDQAARDLLGDLISPK